MARYDDWASIPAQLEGAIASGRLAGELAALFPSTSSLSSSAKRDAAIAELLAGRNTSGWEDIKDHGAVGDDTADDTAAIQAAIAAVIAAGGGVVYVPPGTYRHTALTGGSNVHLVGAGAGLSTLRLTATGVHQISFANDSAWSVRRLTMTGPGMTTTTGAAILGHASTTDMADIEVSDCVFSGYKPSSAVIYILGDGNQTTAPTKTVSRVRIARNRITDFADVDPLTLGQQSDAIQCAFGVRDLWIDDNSIDATSGKNGVAVFGDARAVRIRGNVVRNSGATGSGGTHIGYGILVYSGSANCYCEDVVVGGNHVENTARAGIYLQGCTQYAVANNTLRNCDQYTLGLGAVGVGSLLVTGELDIDSLGFGVVHGNAIDETYAAGISAIMGPYGRARCVISQNVIRGGSIGTALVGISVEGRNVIVSANHISGYKARCIFLRNSTVDRVGDVTITDNEMSLTGAGANYGIDVHTITNELYGTMVITGNRITGATQYATQIGVIRQGDVSHNKAVSCANGFRIHAVRCAVSDNDGDGGTGTGLRLDCDTGDTAAVIFPFRNRLTGYSTANYTNNPDVGTIHPDGPTHVVDGWVDTDVADAQTNAELTRALGRWVAPRAGSVVGVSAALSEARTAGTLTVAVFKNTGLAGAAGSTIGLAAVIDGTNTSRKATAQAKGLDTFVAGDELYCVVTTASWTPTTSDLSAAIEVALD